VGKTTLVRAVLPRVPFVDHIVGSSVLRLLAGEDFNRFDHLPSEVKDEFRRRAIGWMEDHQAREGKTVLCDGHTSLLDESTGKVGAVFTERDCRFFRELILVEAPLEVILARRAGDDSKRRSLDPAVVAAELHAERETAARIAGEWGMRLHRLPPNTDARAAERLMEILS
jgi:adenylate kinase